jgi:hypothetical protein
MSEAFFDLLDTTMCTVVYLLLQLVFKSSTSIVIFAMALCYRYTNSQLPCVQTLIDNREIIITKITTKIMALMPPVSNDKILDYVMRNALASTLIACSIVFYCISVMKGIFWSLAKLSLSVCFALLLLDRIEDTVGSTLAKLEMM